MKKIIDLNKLFYAKSVVEDALVEFNDVLSFVFIDDFKLELTINDDYDAENVVDEFLNFLLSLMKSNFSEPAKEVVIDEICNEPNKFRIDNVDYFYNFFRYEKNVEDYLLVNDIGDFLFLSNDDFENYNNNKIGDNKVLIDKLLGKNFLFENGEYSKLASLKSEKMSYLFQGPSLHIIVVSLRCNLKCVYCHASSVPMNKMEYDLDEETAIKTVDRIFDSPSKTITIEFQGGEPLLNFEIIKFIIEYARTKNKGLKGDFKKDLKFALVSNLVYMTDEILNYLIGHEVGICTSIDGPEYIHNKNRQCYNDTINWVKKINEKYSEFKGRDYELNALPTITKTSLSYPKELVDEYISLGFKSIFLKQLNPLGAAKKSEDIFYSADEYFNFWKTVLDYIIELNLKGVKINEYLTKIMLKKIFLKQDPNYCELRSPCGAVTGQILYNHDGVVFSCDEGRMLGDDMFKLGTVDDSYVELTTNPTSCSIIAASITDVQHCDTCIYKPYCGICPVLNYSISNSVISNISAQDRCKILKMQFSYIFEKIKEDKFAKKLFLDWIKE